MVLALNLLLDLLKPSVRRTENFVFSGLVERILSMILDFQVDGKGVKSVLDINLVRIATNTVRHFSVSG